MLMLQFISSSPYTFLDNYCLDTLSCFQFVASIISVVMNKLLLVFVTSQDTSFVEGERE